MVQVLLQEGLDKGEGKGALKMAQNHYSTKPKRRSKSGRRKDPSAATMAALKKLSEAQKPAATHK